MKSSTLPNTDPFAIPEGLAPKERILLAASYLFYTQGIHATGVDAIAAFAKTNKMTLYRHFTSKDVLIVSYLRRLAEDGVKLWNEYAEKYPNDPLTHLLSWIEKASPTNTDDGGRGCAFANAAAELPNKDHPGRRIIEEYKNKFRVLILDLCIRANLRDPEILTDELHLLYEGARASLQYVGIDGPAARFLSMVHMAVEAHKPK